MNLIDFTKDLQITWELQFYVEISWLSFAYLQMFDQSKLRSPNSWISMVHRIL